MATNDPETFARRFGVLYERWDGVIPYDDLSTYLDWYRRLSRDGRHRFKVRALVHILHDEPARDAATLRRITQQINAWFPRDV